MTVTRGTTNRNERGSSYTRLERREWLVETYRADTDVLVDVERIGFTLYPLPGNLLEVDCAEILNLATRFGLEPKAACRCYRCGCLLTVDTVTSDRIKAGIEGGKYGTPKRDRREGRTNVRPACGTCNSQTGAYLCAKRRTA